MSRSLDVTDVNVDTLLSKLREREWMIPSFQRDFVWSINDIANLVYSILEARPIGMATLWQQPDDSGLPLEPVSVPDSNATTGIREVRPLAGSDDLPNRVYAVLDGRQRCTAIAMAFGGLRSSNNRFRFAGRFFLNVAEKEPSRRIEYIREAQIARRRLDVDSNCVGLGLFPLSSNIEGEAILAQWYRYTQAITNPENYPDGELPDDDELERRNQVLATALDGLINTKLAVYIVPSSYTLAEICEIFETLNTTGTQVSTVDLIHSWLYADTQPDAEPLLLREWIDDLGELDGAIGWANSTDRPELIAQISTACYLALEAKPPPREVGRHRQTSILSVKSGDLLATPTLHWRNIIENKENVAEYLKDFQICVSGGCFTWKSCPYPVTAAIYVALRWHHNFDRDETHQWDIQDLNAIFRAFFWRNALSGRYDQGFLTQLGTDLAAIKDQLNRRTAQDNFGAWAASSNEWLDNHMDKPLPDTEYLADRATNRQVGALQKALLLPMLAQARTDLIDVNISIEYPHASEVHLHHIYPLNWSRRNQTGDLAQFLNPNESEKNWIGSASNLMPLSRESNLKWKDANPGAVLLEEGIQFEAHRAVLEAAFIDEACFDLLLRGGDALPDFWQQRAALIAEELISRTRVTA